MFIFDYLLIFLAIGIIFWSLLFFFKKRNMREAKYLAFFIFFTGFWMLSLYIALFVKSVFGVILWTRMSYFFGFLAILYFLFFISIFYNLSENLFKKYKIIIIISFIFCILNFILPNNYIYSGVEIFKEQTPRGQYGNFYKFFSIFILCIILLTIKKIFSEYKNLTNKKRQQIKYVILGGIVAILGGMIFVVLLPLFGIEEFYSIGPLFFMFFIGFTSYAIIKHQLLDIRIIIQRSIIYSFSLAFIVALYLVLLFIFEFIFKSITSVTMTSAITTVIIGIYGVPLIEGYFKKITDKIFFKNKYNYSVVLYEISEILNNNISLEVLLEKIFNKFKKILKVEKIRIIVLGQGIVFDEYANLRSIREEFPSEFEEMIVGHNNSVLTNFDIYKLLEKIDHQNKKDLVYKKVLERAQKLEKENDFEIFVAMISRKKLIGLMFLGRKMSGDDYTKEDINLLKTFAHQAAVALEKSQLYEKAKDYSRELEKKVKKRTSRISGLQEEQKQMMLEIAHGLQTPLTIIKGQLSALQEEIKHSEKIESLEKSIDRISKFIYAMLRSAKLDSRDKSEYKLINLSALLEEFSESVHIIIQEKSIKLIHDIEENICIMGNKGEIEELLMNLISNSIKYMNEDRENKIIINLYRHKNKHNKAILTIEDTGIGISSEHLPNLFSKFYRIKDDTKTKGTGLGLVICKKIVEKHNGRIKVESQVGKGTKFIIDFPLKK
ncbi:hypothetical protein A2331_03540 [Candidatus Falkowbacteria bacterium RIFOXYB2_FULL_34_18]|uniref:histidine kinase n=1 Tax=Candidatus Falkowbacteria bacterium RIFOXYD2_FULL_34_120 TaxID=1798007 RepID=A0A1F5TS87_9BACT|nr:MAG: hypothetical protein A2331_03540 [Candidatus Falkowbacteria bacterium RIFOXYB2_FULL_34_18]OGF30105.1 MAG: hypothetical protein A2500_04910 [Candidatus Falkowbacteria bacterium RIFOXYC12_FULL_34_55]OGF37561.1 MAG: hypothetical protein A2466_01935 [Candidatus Falkowbacteria bacterium RIFOXYC2_FULL_34_220]OGF39317.1 MAG: hypothetical protein A2515_02350 [Candidatus Falkowbacteria bacterium RIFOXYD12_FULL_34_57]OGF41822.1 MAG: hypothetical protein A2531_05335 [Candidatus Falkowbacteria bact